ncbi:TPA: reverse transcriptase domain-containing protein [Salmonella enterica subsp. enterica serovar Newport]|nr:hypothetical protein [Salmonella enterica]
MINFVADNKEVAHNSYVFRPARSTTDAIEQIFITCAMKASPVWILEDDIKGCFDNISHNWLLANHPHR